MKLIALLVTVTAPLTLAGCGGAGAIRAEQDWAGVTDARLWRTVHVDDDGCGVVLAREGRDLYILTVAHLVDAPGAKVKVYLPDPATGGYDEREAVVLVRSHPHKEDLALVQVVGAPEAEAPVTAALAAPFKPGEQRQAQLMATFFGAERRPQVITVPLVERSLTVSSYLEDEVGQTEWEQSKGCLHGGLVEATSGSPVFIGDRLVGLVESSPFFARRPDGVFVQGVCISLPTEVRAFLETAGYGRLLVE